MKECVYKNCLKPSIIFVFTLTFLPKDEIDQPSDVSLVPLIGIKGQQYIMLVI